MYLPFLIGIVLAIGTAVFARRSGFDRDRAFYATVVIVVAHYYVLFAAIGGSTRAVVLDSIVMTGFVIAAVTGFKSSQWIVAAALAGHGLLDAVHGQVIDNAGVPEWWPAFCAAFDLAAGACLAWMIKTSAKEA